jgi:GTP-binding protein HflX
MVLQLFFDRPESGQRAILVHVRFSAHDEALEIQEFEELVRAADIESLAVLTGRRKRPDARWFIGTGKLDELRAALAQHAADLVVFDHELSPAQQRNMEKELKCRVVTRTELILFIFAARARTHEGQLQVELAQLRHAQTRLVRGWTHLDRQKGGIGLRGAGETQIELDARILSDRVRAIEKRLEKVRKQRQQGRRARQRADVATVALVGYTNAGKSTLFNRLTAAHVLAADRLFATLDPTLRKLPVEGLGEMVLADTVGFIRHLPHSLVEAFKATLEEVVQADLLLHVIDANAPDSDERSEQVRNVLKEIGADEQPVLEVYNKIDLGHEPPRVENDDQGQPARVWVSAQRGDGIELLQEAITRRLGVDAAPTPVWLSPDAGKTRSWLYRMGAVVAEQVADDGQLQLMVRLNPQSLAQLACEPGVLLPGSQAVHRISPSRRLH